MVAELARTTQYNKFTPKIYDLTKDANGQGLVSESYEMIVALHVLHAVPDIRCCLLSLKDLLVPGGTLLVIEIDGTSWGGKIGSVWFDCIFGSFPEWFAFTDGRTHCTMPPTSWMQSLQDLGFVNTRASVEPGNGGHNFVFTAQKPSSVGQIVVHDGGDIDGRHVLQYSFGHEMELQSHLSQMNPRNHIDLYVTALDGRDGDSAMGLCATLGREFPFWDVHLAIFQSIAHLSDPLPFISSRRSLYKNGERVIFFPCEGSPSVPRVTLSSAPTTVANIHPLVLHDSDHSIIEVVASESTLISLNGFVGRVLMSHRKTLSPGDLVAGITTQSKAPILTVPGGCVVSLDRKSVHYVHLPAPEELVKLVAPRLILDCLPKRLEPDRYIQVLVATMDEHMSHSMTTYFQAIDGVTLLQSDFRQQDSSRRVDVLISDSLTSTRYPHIRYWVARSGRFLLWDNILRDNIRDGTRDIAYALKSGLLELPAPEVSCKRLPHSYCVPDSTSYSPLFRHDKTYILLGGIGGLGVDLAVWMYQVRAL
jgi:SAM-dependent methyltransferase